MSICDSQLKNINTVGLRWILIIVLLSMISACSITNKALNVVGLGSKNDLKNISVESIINSNQDTPVAIDLVFISDEKVSDVLGALNGPQWFEDKAALSKRYSDSLDIASLEIVPLSLLEKVALPKNSQNAHSILLFTNYRSTKGQYVAQLSHFKRLNIRLLRDAYELVELDG